MAHGLPDYYRGVDIAYQALAQMIVRPKYGGARSSSGSKDITPMGTVNLVTINGKGMVYGGVIFLDHTSTQKNSFPRIRVDDWSMSLYSFKNLNDFKISQPRSYIITLLEYDDTNFVYSVGIPYGITFESKLELYYTDDHNDTPKVFYNLIYSLI